MKAVGLYDPAYEHDACGVAFVARLDGVASHETLVRAATALGNLEHRGAAGADALTGDGAGMMLQLPDAFFRAEIGAALPPLGRYGVAVCFLPRDAERPRRSSDSWPRRSRPRGRRSSRGATSRSTSATRARPPPRPRRASGSSSSPQRRTSRRTPSSASST